MNTYRFFTIFLMSISCSSSPDPSWSPDLSGGSMGGSSQDRDEGVCVTGEKRTCHVTLGRHGGVMSCFVGVQSCFDGEWSTCGEE